MKNCISRTKYYLNSGWSFFAQKDPQKKHTDIEIPHTPVVLSHNCFDEDIYQDIYHYSKTFTTLPQWEGAAILLTVEGAAHRATVIFNGNELYTHKCGYTAFTVDITQYLNSTDKENTLEIILDSCESLDQPPFGNVIDYMTYAGLYREVYIEQVSSIYMKDVAVFSDMAYYSSTIELNKIPDNLSLSVTQSLYKKNNDSYDQLIYESEPYKVSGNKCTIKSPVLDVESWSLNNPNLYKLVTHLKDTDGNIYDTNETITGFRTISFDSTGFYLNGEKIKLRGLNRHQSYPYIGYAAPEKLQKDDAFIIKNKLGCNIVRTSHYPQSQYFIDECDRLGLLVFTEIPGWQHIGESDDWKEQTLNNVRDMVLQYRNHPSIILWGVRINESQDCDELYEKTNELARQLDPTRPTGGVRFLKNSHFFEDVYTYNDFVHNGTNTGLLHKKSVTKSRGGYLVSEYCGHMYPVKSFDSELMRTDLALRHARIADCAAKYNDIAGAIGWCAFDYHTHNDFGSGDRICYHGVMDMFRNPKLASFVYASQKDYKQAADCVLEVSTDMHIGDFQAGTLGEIWAFTNAPAIKVYDNGEYVKTYTSKDSPFKGLAHGPILIDDMIGDRLVSQDKINPLFAPSVKKLLFIIRKYTVDKTPLKYKVLFALLMLCGAITPKRMEQLYFKYMGSWGGNSRVTTVEAVDKDNNPIKTIKRGARVKQISLALESLRDTLIQGSSYDSVEINIKAVDEHENILHYCQEPFTVKCEGAVKLIGSEISSLKGGMGGVYIRTKGQSGKGTVTVKDWLGNIYTKEFTVINDSKVLKL